MEIHNFTRTIFHRLLCHSKIIPYKGENCYGTLCNDGNSWFGNFIHIFRNLHGLKFHGKLWVKPWFSFTFPLAMVSIPISISCFTISISCFFHPAPTISITIGYHYQLQNFRQIPPENIFSLKFELLTTQFKINHTGVYFIHPPQNSTVLSTTQKGQNYGT